MDTIEIVRVLHELGYEVRNLRRSNEILAAQVGVIEVFRAALIGKPSGLLSSGEDIAWRGDRLADALKDFTVNRKDE